MLNAGRWSSQARQAVLTHADHLLTQCVTGESAGRVLLSTRTPYSKLCPRLPGFKIEVSPFFILDLQPVVLAGRDFHRIRHRSSAIHHANDAD